MKPALHVALIVDTDNSEISSSQPFHLMMLSPIRRPAWPPEDDAVEAIPTTNPPDDPQASK